MDKEIDVRAFSQIPFKEKGRDYDGGDCWVHPYLIYRDRRGINLPAYLDGYHTTADREEIARIMRERRRTWEKVDRPQPYDIVQIRMLSEEMHVGVCIGAGKFIHCLAGVGTQIDRLKSPKWRDRIVGYYRYKK
jgi:cell wall-associated NlpC family hydrolase